MALLTPEQLAKSGSESGEQKALFAFANMARWRGLETAWQWANGGKVMPFQHTTEGVRVLQEEIWPCLKWLHAIPNGGSRGDDEQSRKIRGSNLKAEGVRKGVADVCLPFRRAQFSGLYLELKRKDAGRVSTEQSEFGDFVTAQGFAFEVCHGWRHAAESLSRYLRWNGQEA